jgi:hypothetical protein
MKLLVGGDSFAQFPNGQWYQSSAESHITDKHWCQLIDKNTVSVGYGAGDLYTTSFVTTQKILQDDDITHCIFFITNASRDIIQTKGNDAIKLADNLHETFSIEYYLTDYIDSHISKNKDSLSNYMFFDGDFLKSKYFIPYFTAHADFKHIHTKLSVLSLLKTLCDRKDVKLIFVAPFDVLEVQNNITYFTGVSVFNLLEIFPNLQEWISSEEALNTISHFSSDMHFKTANHFHKIYPNWLDK